MAGGTVNVPRLPRLMGIANITPDSFSDGGKALSTDAAIAHIAALVEAGAAIIDIGAESTRPDAVPLSAAEEWQRLETLLPQVLARWKGKVILSLDTRHAETAARALASGVDWINDVSGASDMALLEAVAAYPAAHYVLMHSLSVPARRNSHLPEDCDPVAVLQDFAMERLGILARHGIAAERVVYDPGIGFGKTAAQSWDIIRRIGELKQALPMPILVGHSRKSFLKDVTAPEAPAAERDAATLAVSLHLAAAGVEYLRVHAVAAHRQALDAWARCRDV